MADPISMTVAIACGSLKLASSIAKFMDEREERERERERAAKAREAVAAPIPKPVAATPFVPLLFGGNTIGQVKWYHSRDHKSWTRAHNHIIQSRWERERLDRLDRERFERQAEEREAVRKAQAFEQEATRRAQLVESAADEILFVLAVLGQRLFHLEVVAFGHIPDVLRTVKTLFRGETMRARFESSLDDSLRYAVVAALFFCAECWPMHMYRGFGCAVLNDFTQVS